MSISQVDPENEYSKDKNLSKTDVKKLLTWMDAQPHLPKATEFQAITFLHSSYYDLEAAKKSAENFFTLRTMYSHLFGSSENAEIIRDTLSTFFMAVLPDRTTNGDAIFVCRMIDTRPARFNLLNFQKVSDMILTVHLYKYGTFNGLVEIYDFKGASFGHLFRANLKVIRNYAEYTENAFPMRVKQVHILSTSTIAQAMLNIGRPFLSGKILDKQIFHSGDNKTIHNYIPPEILPKEFYGTGQSIDELQEGQVEDLIGCLDLFEFLQKQQVDKHKKKNY